MGSFLKVLLIAKPFRGILLRNILTSVSHQESSRLTEVSDNEDCDINTSDLSESENSAESDHSHSYPQCERKVFNEYKIESEALQKLLTVLKNNVEAATIGIPIDSYFTEGKLDQNSVSVEVSGIGKITFPISPEVAVELMAMASPASFDQGDHTYDRNVRDCYVIPQDKLNVEIKNFEDLLSEIKVKLALGKDTGLKAHLYNMLIYKEGQFFDYHQDTEKMDDMVATLVVSLPSAHIGGDLTIMHMDKTYVFSSETFKADHVKYVAFYSDCFHKIEKIREGFRIVLTYNLVLDNPSFKPTTICSQDMVDVIQDYFNNDSIDERSYARLDWKIPKLVYLLDHRYTKKHLKFSKLKGSDSQTASVFLSAAKKLNLKLHLTTAEVHEHWDDEVFGFQLASLETTLDEWRNESDVRLHYKAYDAPRKQVCWSIPNKRLKPYKVKNSEYTSCEQWYKFKRCRKLNKRYRRAAIVLWPRSADIKMRFLLNFDDGLKIISKLMQSTDNRKTVKKILKIVDDVMLLEVKKSSSHTAELVSLFVKLAIYIQNEKKALKICEVFCNDIFTCRYHNLFCELRDFYGYAWVLELLNESRIKNPEVLDFLSLLKRKEERPLVEQILKYQMTEAEKEYSIAPKDIRRYGVLLKAAYKVESFDTVDEVLKNIMLRKWNNEMVAQFYIDYCQNMEESITKTTKKEIVSLLQKDLGVLKEKKSLHEKWLSRVIFGTCLCDLCRDMNNFLRSGQKVMKLKINKGKRDHLCGIFESKNRDLFTMRTEKVRGPLFVEKNNEFQEYCVDKLTKLEDLLQEIQRNVSGSTEDKVSSPVGGRAPLKRLAPSQNTTTTTAKMRH